MPRKSSTPKPPGSSKSRSIDRTDLRILEMLQADGRITNVQISQHLDMMPASTLRRMQLLYERGLVSGYHAQLDPARLGYPVLVFLRIELEPNSAQGDAQFNTLIQRTSNVRQCHVLDSTRERLLQCHFASATDAQHFVTDELLRLECVLAVTSSFCMRISKNAPGLPLSLANAAGRNRARAPSHGKAATGPLRS